MDIMIPLNTNKAYDTMGMHIQDMANKLKLKYPVDFSFIKLCPCDKEFTDMVFRYKNQVYAILMDITHNGKHIASETNNKRDFIKVAKENNLIPCLFPIALEFKPTTDEHGHGIHLTEFEMPELEYTVVKSDTWNLINAETNEPVNPLDIASDEPIKMSDYELYNFAVLVASQLLEEKGAVIKSISDIPGYYPQIILNDDSDKEYWCIIAYSTEHDIDAQTSYKKQLHAHFLKAIKNADMVNFMATHDGVLFSLYIKDSLRTDIEHRYKYHFGVVPCYSRDIQ